MVDDAKEAVFPRHNRADEHMDLWRLYLLLLTLLGFLLLSAVFSLLSSVGHRQGLLEKDSKPQKTVARIGKWYCLNLKVSAHREKQ